MILSTESLELFLVRNELSDIVLAIEKLTEKDWWWDFTVPILTAAVVAILASVITFFFTKQIQRTSDEAAAERDRVNQKVQIENNNRAIINELVLTANSCCTTLLAIRDNYLSRLNTDLMTRILSVPLIKAVTLEPVDKSFLPRLSFITPSNGDEVLYWSQLPHIDMVMSNYNACMALWEERNARMEEFYADLARVRDMTPITSLNTAELIFDQFPDDTFIQLTQLTERCIGLTRELLHDLNDLLSSFKEVYGTKFDTTLPRELLLRVLDFDNDSLLDRMRDFSDEPLPNLGAIRGFFPDEASFKSIKKGLLSRHDFASS